LYNVLKTTKTQFDELGNGRFLNTKQREDIIKGAFAIKKVKINLTELKDQAVAKIMPPLTLLMERFFIWLNKHGDEVIDVIQSTLQAMMVFAGSIMRVASAGARLINFLSGSRKGLLILLGLLVYFAARLSPLHKGLLLLFLVIDDILAYLEGAPSVIGDFIDAFDLEKLLKGLGLVVGVLSVIYGLWKSIAKTAVGQKMLDIYDKRRDQQYYQKGQNAEPIFGDKKAKSGAKPSSKPLATKGMGLASKLFYSFLGWEIGDEIANSGIEGKNDTTNWLKALGGGAIKGAAIGSAVGSVVPGVGNVAGGVIGGIGGAGWEGFQKYLKEQKEVNINNTRNTTNNITQNITGNADANDVADATINAINMNDLGKMGFMENNQSYLD
jgi:hypothetical protein